MVKIPNRIQKIISNYISLLEKNNIPLRRVVLFGSYANGTSDGWSDIDLAVVSDKFGGDWFEDRDKIRPMTVAASCDLEVLPYSPANFSMDDPFVKKILETGVKIL